MNKLMIIGLSLILVPIGFLLFWAGLCTGDYLLDCLSEKYGEALTFWGAIGTFMLTGVVLFLIGWWIK